MVTVFNRQLLISTYATEEQARIRDMLRAAAIPYLVRTSDATLRFSEPDRRGSVLIRTELQSLHILRIPYLCQAEGL